ncbi:hypothetical protein ACLOJK_015964 [Asimina triloba]
MTVFVSHASSEKMHLLQGLDVVLISSVGVQLDASVSTVVSQEKACSRKRGHNESCGGPGSKACREKMRRDKMNDKYGLQVTITFLGAIYVLAFTFEFIRQNVNSAKLCKPGRPVKSDKSAILSDAIRALNQLRSETQELKEANEKLQEDIKALKAEKNELREEKLVLKADKERMEQQMKSVSVVPFGFVPPHPVAAYPPGAEKMMAYPAYGGFPMWQWIPPAARDTSEDHILRPPNHLTVVITEGQSGMSAKDPGCDRVRLGSPRQ